jgi:hypothetical protein
MQVLIGTWGSRLTLVPLTLPRPEATPRPAAAAAPARGGRRCCGFRSRFGLAAQLFDVTARSQQDVGNLLRRDAVDVGERRLVGLRDLLGRLEPVLEEQLGGHVTDTRNGAQRQPRPARLFLGLGFAAHFEFHPLRRDASRTFCPFCRSPATIGHRGR